MSAHKRVMDYMKSAPDGANHISLWEKAEMDKMRERADGLELERRSLGPAERDILAALEGQAKFTRAGMVHGINIGINVDARTTKGDRVTRTKKVNINFEGSGNWRLAPAVANVDYVTRDPMFYTLDTRLRDNIIRQCPEMSATQLGELRVEAVKDALTMPVDMRHMFMKMTLMLWDYTLAAASKLEGFEMADDIVDCRHEYIPADARMLSAASNRVVIDSQGMSPRELGLLQLSAQEYPSVWYAGDNVYTKCHMDADDLAILSDGAIDMDTSGLWGSPDTLYQTMWSLASKLGAVKCLVEALTVMRGRCQHMADLTARIGPVSVYSGVPRSICKTRSMGPVAADTIITKAAGYYSTTLSLIADNLFGRMFELVATSVIEDVGGLGDKLCGKSPATDRMYHGLLRDIGTRHDDASVNQIMRGWCAITGSPIHWGYQGMLKDYAVVLTSVMKAGWDTNLAQLFTLIPYQDAKRSCWAFSRGCRSGQDIFDQDSATDRALELGVCAWLMGERSQRPRVGPNRSKKASRYQSSAERELAAEAGAGFVVGHAALWIDDDVGGREDEYEEAMGALFKSSFPNVKCQLLYDVAEQAWHLPTVQRDYPSDVKRSLGFRLEAEVEPAITGPAPRPAPSSFQGVRTMLNSKPVRPSAGPRPEVRLDGGAVVPPYSVKGEKKEAVLPINNTKPSPGEMRIQRIDVPGDGQCGLHAVVEDLKAHALLSVQEGARLLEKLQGETRSTSFHSVDEIAGAVLKMGLGLDVLADGTMHSFGHNDRHRVSIELANNHYSPIYRSEDGDPVQVQAVHHQEVDDREYIRRLGEFERMLGSAVNI